jgi:hypothetical protein
LPVFTAPAALLAALVNLVVVRQADDEGVGHTLRALVVNHALEPVDAVLVRIVVGADLK